MTVACPISDTLITWTPANEEPFCGNAAAVYAVIIIIIIITISFTTTINTIFAVTREARVKCF